MKIIEALKELPVLEKRIADQTAKISEYATLLTAETSPFGTPEEQKRQVAQLVQSNYDLATRYGSLKRALAITNAKLPVTVSGETKTINEWITYKAKGFKQIQGTLNALDIQTGMRRMGQIQLDAEKGIRLDRMFEEAEKNAKLAKIREIHDSIDATLEIVNATTDLLEEP